MLKHADTRKGESRGAWARVAPSMAPHIRGMCGYRGVSGLMGSTKSVPSPPTRDIIACKDENAVRVCVGMCVLVCL